MGKKSKNGKNRAHPQTPLSAKISFIIAIQPFYWCQRNARKNITVTVSVRVRYLKQQSSNCGKHHKCRIASPCQISWRLVKPLSRYLIFGFLKMLAATSSDFKMFYILTIWTVKKNELRHCAKFCRNHSNHGVDMAIFRFFKMATAAILDFGNFKFLTAERSRGSNCIIVPNFVKIGPTAAEIWLFLDFSKWRPPPSWIFEISNF